MSFYQLLANYYDDIFPLNPGTLAFLSKQFRKSGGTRLLDLACGSGSYTLPLSREGFDVTGLDLDRDMIRLAQEKRTRQLGNVPHPEFIQGDMLELSRHFSREFAGVFCIGNSLVHLDSDVKLEQGLSEAAKILKPGGSFIAQVVNYDRILRDQIEELPAISAADKPIVFRRFYRYDDQKHVILFTGELSIEGEGTFRETVPLLPLTREKFQALLGQSGFTSCRFWGSFAEEDWSLDTPATIVHATYSGTATR